MLRMERSGLQFPNNRTKECFVPSTHFRNGPKPIVPPPWEVVLSQPLTPAHDVTALEDAIHHPDSEILFLDASLQYLLHTLHTHIQVELDKGFGATIDLPCQETLSLPSNNLIPTDIELSKRSMSSPGKYCLNDDNVNETPSTYVQKNCGFNMQPKNYSDMTANEPTTETRGIIKNIYSDRGIQPYFKTRLFTPLGHAITMFTDKGEHLQTVGRQTHEKPSQTKCDKNNYPEFEFKSGGMHYRKVQEDEEKMGELFSSKLSKKFSQNVFPEETISPKYPINNVKLDIAENNNGTISSTFFTLHTQSNIIKQSGINYNDRNVLLNLKQNIYPSDSILKTTPTKMNIARDSGAQIRRPPYPIQVFNDRCIPRSYVNPHITGPSDMSLDSETTPTGFDTTSSTKESNINKANFSNISSIFAFMNPILSNEIKSKERVKTNGRNNTLYSGDKNHESNNLEDNKENKDFAIQCKETHSKRFDRFRLCFDVKKPVNDFNNFIHKDSVADMFDNSPVTYFRNQFDKGVIMKDEVLTNCTHNVQQSIKPPHEIAISDASTKHTISSDLIPCKPSSDSGFTDKIYNARSHLPNSKTLIYIAPENPPVIQRYQNVSMSKMNDVNKYVICETGSQQRQFFLGDNSLSTISEERSVSTTRSDGIKSELLKVAEEEEMSTRLHEKEYEKTNPRRGNSAHKIQEIYHNKTFASSVSSFGSENKLPFTRTLKGRQSKPESENGGELGAQSLGSVGHKLQKEKFADGKENHKIMLEDSCQSNSTVLPIKNNTVMFSDYITSLRRDELHSQIERVENGFRLSPGEKKLDISSNQNIYTYNHVGKSGDISCNTLASCTQIPDNTHAVQKVGKLENYYYSNRQLSKANSKHYSNYNISHKTKTSESNNPSLLFQHHSGGESPTSVTNDINIGNHHSPVKPFIPGTHQIPVPHINVCDWSKTSQISRDYLSRSKVYQNHMVDVLKSHEIYQLEDDDMTLTHTTKGRKNVDIGNTSNFDWSFIKKIPGFKSTTVPSAEEEQQKQVSSPEQTNKYTNTQREDGDSNFRRLVPRFEWFKSPRSVHTNSNHGEKKQKGIEKNVHEQTNISQPFSEKNSDTLNWKQWHGFELHNFFKRPRSTSPQRNSSPAKTEDDNTHVTYLPTIKRTSVRSTSRKSRRRERSSINGTSENRRHHNQVREEKSILIKQQRRYHTRVCQDLKDIGPYKDSKQSRNKLYVMESTPVSVYNNSTALGYSRLSPYYQQWLAKRRQSAPKFTQENLEEFKKKIVLPPKVQQHYEAQERKRKSQQENLSGIGPLYKGNNAH